MFKSSLSVLVLLLASVYIQARHSNFGPECNVRSLSGYFLPSGGETNSTACQTSLPNATLSHDDFLTNQTLLQPNTTFAVCSCCTKTRTHCVRTNHWDDSCSTTNVSQCVYVAGSAISVTVPVNITFA